MNHTPAPWKWGPTMNSERAFVVEGKGGTVAFARTEANTRLISAAPELLEALKLIVEDMRTPALVSLYGAERVQKLFDAIAKAEGKAKV